MADRAMQAVAENTTFNSAEIAQIFENFGRLTASGHIDKNEFLRVMGCTHVTASNVFLDALFKMLDQDKNGNLDSYEFAIGLAIYQGKMKKTGDPIRKKLFFKMYDVDGDGEISTADLEAILTSTFAASSMIVNPDDIRGLVSSTFAKYQLLPSGRISFDSFCASSNGGFA